MIRFPNAKINLGLDIVSRREDGYHNISTLFYPVKICDALEIVPAQTETVMLLTSGNLVDCPVEKNLVMKAYRMLEAEFNLPPVDIYLQKQIPDGAGLGGGSADASVTLQILRDMFKLDLTNEELALRAAKLGADCPFFIYNKPMFAEGIGNEFTEAQTSMKGYWMVLVKPDVYVSTKLAYSRVKPAYPVVKICEIVSRPVKEWKGLLKNDFEPSVFAEFPELEEIKNKFYAAGAEYASMSGSGSSMFGIFSSVNMAESVYATFDTYKKYLVELQ